MKKEKQFGRRTDQLPLPEPANMLNLFAVDPLGSYTGVPDDLKEIPVQDADDL